uniref:Uncharacterized protein LOC111103597 n=1 Tax=Crassostrea virginica TaxID=6565 RepID=A0A8B8ANS2_CRAVI|nr:uncharacterized protein LOC111103597 [Crassostrea virginica]
MVDFEEMDTINPVNDLVVFRPIKDITSGMQSLPVTYDLGLDFHPHLNDWVGLFYTGWDSVNDFLEYRWAPMLPRDLRTTTHRKQRSVIFDPSSFSDLREEDAYFCFLYVTRDSHVVGVSNNFQFRSMPGFEDDLCFDNLEQRVRNDSSFTFISIDSGFEYLNNIQSHHNRKRGIDESFEVVNNETPPQKRRSTKERVMIRTQDPDTLVTLSTEQWQDIFRIVSERSVVRKVDGGATVSRGVVAKPIFNINNRVSTPSQNASLEVWNTQSASPSLTFENRLAILPGPVVS